MNKSKNKLLTAGLALLIAVGVGSASAFLTDNRSEVIEGKVGNLTIKADTETVIEGKGIIAEQENLKFVTNLQADGNKSSDVKLRYAVEAFDKDGQPLDLNGVTPFSLKVKVGDKEYVDGKDGVKITEEVKDNRAVYTLSGTPFILDGKHSEELHEEDGIYGDAFTINASLVLKEESADVVNGGKFETQVLTEIKQHRNSTDDDWENLSIDDVFLTNKSVKAVPEKEDKTSTEENN